MSSRSLRGLACATAATVLAAAVAGVVLTAVAASRGVPGDVSPAGAALFLAAMLAPACVGPQAPPARFSGSNHLRCVFGTGEPTCESHFAMGNSMLIIDGNPGTVVGGTGRFLGATGRVVSNTEVEGGSDVVAKIRLR